MNLQRDTDHALRIIICIINLYRNKSSYKQGVSLYNICIKTGVSRINAARICDTLSQKDILKASVPNDGSSSSYLPAKNIENVSLYDIINIIEGNTNLFALFNVNHKYLAPSKEKLTDINDTVNKFLNQIKVKDFL